ncbi:MAG: hypothetical protein R2729_22795 [Bryobacteraceae bacterium]
MARTRNLIHLLACIALFWVAVPQADSEDFCAHGRRSGRRQTQSLRAGGSEPDTGLDSILAAGLPDLVPGGFTLISALPATRPALGSMAWVRAADVRSGSRVWRQPASGRAPPAFC